VLVGFDALDLDVLRARRTVKWSRYPADVLPAWVAEMDFPLAPAVFKAVRRALDAHDLGYSDSAGLAEAFATWAARNQGWRPDPALACPVADVMAGLEAALRVLTEPGDGVVLLTPSYPPFFTLLKQLGRVAVPWPLLDRPQGWAPDLQRLDDALRGGARGVLLCHPHNPTGRVFTGDELAAVSEIVDSRGGHVISDEVHAPLLAAGVSFIPYTASGPAAGAHSVTVTSISKGWNVPGLKCALLQAQPATAQVTAAGRSMSGGARRRSGWPPASRPGPTTAAGLRSCGFIWTGLVPSSPSGSGTLLACGRIPVRPATWPGWISAMPDWATTRRRCCSTVDVSR
jgi:cystathionine beta-lyase